MRSLASKLILAFIAVSIVSIGIVVVSTRFSTNREFERFISQRDKSEMAEELARYYETNQSWDKVNNTYLGVTTETYGPHNGRPSNYYVADINGVIVSESFIHKIGERINPKSSANSTAIIVNNETVGYLMIENPPPTHNPIEDEFIRRLDIIMLLSALGATLLALLSGIILSRTITKPVRELTTATHAMANGDLSQVVKVHSRDELGELAESFNKMSRDLSNSFNLRKQMTADIAHELRTPLSLIIGHAEAVHDGVLPPTRENFEIIREEAGRLEQLVNDLRTLSLADAGELSIDLQRMDVYKLLSDIHAHFLTLFGQKPVTLNLEPATGPLTANLDPNRFAQVVNNILNNALRYTPENGTVTISTNTDGAKLQIIIQDSGAGVSSEEAAHLFDRFYRADESRTREEGGSGLGLAIAKSIIELHKGKIWAESEKGNGLRIIIQLPTLG